MRSCHEPGSGTPDDAPRRGATLRSSVRAFLPMAVQRAWQRHDPDRDVGARTADTRLEALRARRMMRARTEGMC